MIAGDKLRDGNGANPARSVPKGAHALKRGGQRNHGSRRKGHHDVAADGRLIPDFERRKEGAAALAEERRGRPFRGASN